jgi:hypothetical protein
LENFVLVEKVASLVFSSCSPCERAKELLALNVRTAETVRALDEPGALQKKLYVPCTLLRRQEIK